MIKTFLSLVLALSIFTASPSAEAVVGLIIQHRTTKVVGGIGMAASGVTGAGLIAYANTLEAFAGIGYVILGVGFWAIGGVALIVLDDNTVADIEFRPVTKKEAGKFGEEARSVYNNELDELNAIRKTIQAEIPENASVKDVNQLWNTYAQSLSPETKAIAEHLAGKLAKGLSK
jgi:hypothetical protein